MGRVWHPLGSGEEMSEGEYQAMAAINELEPPPEYFRAIQRIISAPGSCVPDPIDSGRPLRRGFWRVRDGSDIRIRDMTDAHLQNAVRIVVAFAEKLMLREVIRMGEMTKHMGEHAAMGIEDEAGRMGSYGPVETVSYMIGDTWLGKKYCELVEEHHRRGLEILSAYSKPSTPPLPTKKEREFKDKWLKLLGL